LTLRGDLNKAGELLKQVRLVLKCYVSIFKLNYIMRRMKMLI